MPRKTMVGLTVLALGIAACGGGATDGRPAGGGEETGAQQPPAGAETPGGQETATDTPRTASPRPAMPMGGMMGGRMGAMHGRMMGAEPSPQAAPQPEVAAAPGASGCPAVDEALVERGRAVFSGPGLCYSCHGADVSGTPLAPDLTDSSWLNIDGSYPAIAGLIRDGVSSPKQYPAPMPPRGGSSISGADVCAVAAYIYSLTHS